MGSSSHGAGGKQCHTDFYAFTLGGLEGLGFRIHLQNLGLIGVARVLILVSTSIQGKYYMPKLSTHWVSHKHSRT